MAKLTSTKKVLILGDAYAYLREPTAAEWNEYNRDRFKVLRNKTAENNDVLAKCNLFNKICTKLENVFDEKDVVVGIDRIDLIPPYEKTKVIYNEYEKQDEEEVGKN